MTRSTTGPLVALALAAAAFVPFLLAGCGKPASEGEAPQPGRRISGLLNGKEPASHPLPLEEGQYLELLVHQGKVDVAVIVRSPEGTALYAMDSPTGKLTPELVAFVAPRTATYRLEIGPFEEVQEAAYEVEVVAARPTSEGDRRRAEAALVHGRAYGARGEERISGLATAADLWREAGDASRELEALYNLGYALESDGSRREAREAYFRARPLLDEGGEPYWKGSLLNVLALSHLEAEEYPEAAALLEEALEMLADVDFPATLAEILKNLAYAVAVTDRERALDLYDEAEKHLRREIETQPAFETRLALVLDSQAELYLDLKNAPKAVELLTEARELLPRLDAGQLVGNPPGLVRTVILIRLAQAFVESDELFRAQEALEAAATATKEAEGPRGTAWREAQAARLNGVGLVAKRSGRPAEALNAYEQALEIVRDLRDRKAEGLTLRNLGWLHLAQGRFAEAEAVLQLSLRLFEEIDDTLGAGATHRALARLEKERGRLDESRARLEKTIEFLEGEQLAQLGAPMSERSGIGKLRGIRFESEAEGFAPLAPYFDDLIELLLEIHGDNLARAAALTLETSERSFSRALLHTLLDNTVPESLLPKLRRLRAERARLDCSAPAGAKAGCRALERRSAKLLEEIRRHSPGFQDLADAGPISATRLREEILDPETALLEYNLGDRGSHLWLATTDAVEHFPLPPRGEILARVREAVSALQGPSRESWKRADNELRALGRVLLGPVADRLDRPRLAIVSEGELQTLPFAALPSPEDPRSPLIERYEIVRLPSMTTLATLRERLASREPQAGLLAMVAAPAYRPPSETLSASDVLRSPETESLPRPLPYAREEAEEIRKIVRGWKHVAVLGPEANRQRILGGFLQGFRILHFATHARVDTTRPGGSKILVSFFDDEDQQVDGEISSRAIFALDLPAELTVLSACETALGTQVPGEGLVGLTQAFFSAGTRSLVASLWEVRDRATADLMPSFYRYLVEERLAPSAALARAQREMRRREDHEHPVYWAAFEFQGDWRSAPVEGHDANH